MKKTLLFVALAAFMASGCSKTWSGFKQDSREFATDTKQVIHNATAPETHVTASGTMVNPVNNPSVQVVDSVDPTTVQTIQYVPVANVVQ